MSLFPSAPINCDFFNDNLPQSKNYITQSENCIRILDPYFLTFEISKIVGHQMTKLLYFLAAIFLIGWAIGFFLLGLGMLVHLMLLASVVVIIIKIVKY